MFCFILLKYLECQNIRWEFMTEGGDIGFRIYHVNGSKEDIVEVVPVSRIESHLVMEEGEIICDYIGKCEILLK